MVTASLSKFKFVLTLVVDDEHRYDVKSPSVVIGAHINEMASLLMEAESYVDRGEDLPERLNARLEKLSESAPKEFEEDSYRVMLGDAYDKMVEDGMPWEVVKLAAATVGVWVRTDAETAEEFWSSGGRPKAKRPADRKRKTNSSR